MFRFRSLVPEGTKVLVKRIVGGLAAFLMSHGAVEPFARAQSLPTGGSVASGAATIATTGKTMTINQSTQSAIVNWNSFSIGQSYTVNIVQPNSASTMIARNALL